MEIVLLSHPSQLTRDGLLGAIQTRHRQGHSMRADDNRDLMTAVQKHFGGWVKAQVAAGLEPYLERWTKERLVRVIQDRLQQGPVPSDD